MGIKFTGKEMIIGKIPIAKEPFRLDLEKPKTQGFDLNGISKMTLLEMSKRNIAIEIYSELLNCNIWLCSNEEIAAQVKRDTPGAVTYTVNELRQLLKLKISWEELKRVHDTKSVFDKSRMIANCLKEDSDD